MAPRDGIYQIQNVSTKGCLALLNDQGPSPPVGKQIQVVTEKPANSSDAQKWCLTNHEGYITLENFTYKGYYFVYERDEADSPIISTKTTTKIKSTDGPNGRIISFFDGNTNLVMTANQHENTGKLDTRNPRDMKQEWHFQEVQ